MSRTMQHNATTKAAPFEPIASYERLIKLRETSPDTFMLQTSEATRRTIHYYEAAKEKAEVKQ